MRYLYHGVPDDLVGDTLYPLNQLKNVFPEVYLEKVKKYDTRPEQLEQVIEPLHCLWNDVIHLTPIHPSELKRSLESAGRLDFHKRFFEINADSIDPEKAIIYMNPMRNTDPKHFRYERYEPSKLDVYREVPSETIEYFRSRITQGRRPLLFQGVPHILLKDTLGIKSCSIVEV